MSEHECHKIQWTDLIERISRLEEIAESRSGIAGKVNEIQDSLKLLEESVGDVSELDAPNLVEGLNTVLDTIKIMQGTTD